MNQHGSDILIHAYLDNELDTSSALTLLEHASECAACKSRIEHYARLKNGISKELPQYSTPVQLRDKILGFAQPKRSFNWPKVILRWGVPLSTALALGLVIGVMISGEHVQHASTNDLVWNHIHALKSGRLMDVASSDKHTVKPWFAGKTDFSPFVVDLASQGFPLLGARAEYIDGHDVAALVYTNGKHYIELYEWPKEQGSSKMATYVYRGYNTTSFIANAMQCIAITDASKEEVEKFRLALISTTNEK